MKTYCYVVGTHAYLAPAPGPHQALVPLRALVMASGRADRFPQTTDLREYDDDEAARTYCGALTFSGLR